MQGIITGSALNDTDHLAAMTTRCPVVAFDIKRSELDHTRIMTISVDNAAATVNYRASAYGDRVARTVAPACVHRA